MQSFAPRIAGGPAPMRGSSGAQVIDESQSTVIKIGDQRVVEQGYWLLRHNRACLPQVQDTNIGQTGYRMEKLVPVPIVMASTPGTLTAIHYALNDFIWTQRGPNTIDLNAHDAKLQTLRPHLDEDDWDRLIVQQAQVKWGDLTRGLSHGDPTVDNVMLRKDGTLVLIDPIPSTPAVPDYTSVDRGKMLQSALGFEAARYDLPQSPRNVDHMVSTVRARCSSTEWRASVYWCSVHLARALPYMPDPKTKERVHGLLRTSLCL